MANEMEFLRYLMDLISSKEELDQIKSGSQAKVQQPVVVNVDNGDAKNSNGNSKAPEDVESPIDRNDVFVPPLQAKIEMMKKIVNVEEKNKDVSDRTHEVEAENNGAKNKIRNQRLGLNPQQMEEFWFSAENDEPFDD